MTTFFTFYFSYLDIKIKEGDAHNIVCPAFDCNKLVPVEFIERTVSTTMAQRYLQFDIKVSSSGISPRYTLHAPISPLSGNLVVPYATNVL